MKCESGAKGIEPTRFVLFELLELPQFFERRRFRLFRQGYEQKSTKNK